MIQTNEEIKDLNCEVLDRLPEMLACDKNEILFIDIETTGLTPKNSDIYMIGAAYFNGGKWNIRQFFAENSDEEEKVLSAFSDFSRTFRSLVHFNGDRFDIPFLQAKYEVHKLTDPLAHMESFDIYKRIKKYKKQLGIANCKQKTVETFLGIEREDKYDGGKLIEVYEDYEDDRDPELLKILLLHNFEDVKGMLELLPILKYEIFFDMFRNMPKVSVRTDEDILEENYMTDKPSDEKSVQETLDQKQVLALPARAVKVQASEYKDIDGTDKKEVYMKLELPFELPASVVGNYDGCYFRIKENKAVVRVPLYERELKYFYSNYRDYYYLPDEDIAIHKSLAEFVDKNHKEKAKADNCYTRKEGQYLREWDLVFSPFFKEDYEDRNFYFDLNENMKKSRFAMSLYACHVMAHVMGI